MTDITMTKDADSKIWTLSTISKPASKTDSSIIKKQMQVRLAGEPLVPLWQRWAFWLGIGAVEFGLAIFLVYGFIALKSKQSTINTAQPYAVASAPVSNPEPAMALASHNLPADDASSGVHYCDRCRQEIDQEEKTVNKDWRSPRLSMLMKANQPSEGKVAQNPD